MVILVSIIGFVIVGCNVCLSLSNMDLTVLFFILNSKKMMFFMLLMVIFLSIVIYSSFYMSDSVYYSYFMTLMIVFVTSMVGLVFSGGCMSVLIFWDLLGVSSFYLVLYYGNWDSCSGAMNTIMMNRIGDAGVFLVFSGIFINIGGLSSLEGLVGLSLLCFLMSCLTKSAQLPFSSWLPKAMSAPTPVSALVHSSTLVTAGLFLMMSLSSVVYLTSFLSMVFYLGLVTMLIAGLSAYFETDAKKLVALSTLSQMGFCFVSMGMGLVYLSFAHIMSHAIFKSCLFMQVGYVIHSSSSQQDSRSYGFLGGGSVLVQFQIFITLMCLCGLMFLSGGVSKEAVLESVLYTNLNFMVIIIFFVAVMMTFLYSYRLLKFFYANFMVSGWCPSSSKMFSYSGIILIGLSVFFMSWLSNNFYVVGSKLLYFDFYSVFYLFVVGAGFCLISVKGLYSDLKYKFMVDFLPKYFLFNNWNFVWNESLLGLGLMNMLNFVKMSSKWCLGFMGSNGLSIIIMSIIIFILM
uniref:NADH:ubiquinone reductase (H(+)-translocating) n=1 Tax=Philometroides sanguineus TaxID=378106 RepID=A0A0U1XAF6_9BILA|nr:NADH dehydrogenase subunit 5 [Philometroides sanguineus]AIN37110.1 NADH dehydrogenase subunit 5 [Philometroides sanguineus]